MLTHQGRRRIGFTLAEVLVTIAIIAIMAAVLLPAVNSQLSKGDTSRIASDLTNLQSGIQAFVSDIRRYPSTTTQLLNALTGSDINGDTYPSSTISAWKGPYVSRDVLANTGGRASISSTFATISQSSTNFLSFSISPITTKQFEALEAVFDEGTTATTSSTVGIVRYSSGSQILNFLAMPIQ